MTTTLVTGGQGFLGSHLVTRLRNNGEKVRILANSHGKPLFSDPDDSNIIYGDIRDPESVNKAVDGVDYVIHTASNFRKGGSDKDDAYEINVIGTENVLKSCFDHAVKRLVHCSTIGVHGDVREIPAKETTPFNPCDLYQETKLMGEKKVWEFYEKTQMPISVVRPISIIGPGDVRMLKLFKMIKKEKLLKIGPCQAFFQPAYIDDIVDGFMLCLHHEKAIGQVFLIGGEQYVSLEELFSIIAKELGVSPPRFRVPLTPVLLLASICEKICAPLKIPPPLHRRRVSFFQNSRAFSVQKAKDILDYQPKVSMKEAIHRTVKWYKEQGWL